MTTTTTKTNLNKKCYVITLLIIDFDKNKMMEQQQQMYGIQKKKLENEKLIILNYQKTKPQITNKQKLWTLMWNVCVVYWILVRKRCDFFHSVVFFSRFFLFRLFSAKETQLNLVSWASRSIWCNLNKNQPWKRMQIWRRRSHFRLEDKKRLFSGWKLLFRMVWM